jgi:L-2-hydroxyglutarate oxidase LhgO
MATYIITINEKTTEGKGVLVLLQSLKGIVTIKPNALDESLLDIKEGRVNYAIDAKDLINQCSEK